MPGKDGMEKMASILTELRENPPSSINGLNVIKITDYKNQMIKHKDGKVSPLCGLPKSDVLRYDLSDEKSYFIVRPSGTEPKIKLYLGTFADSTDAAIKLIDNIAADCQQQFGLV
jgi:phosphoglucomutase